MSTGLTHDGLMGLLQRTFKQLPDNRIGQNTTYAIADAAAAAFGVFFTQSPSFLSYQRDMQLQKGHNNAQSLFGVEKIPQQHPHMQMPPGRQLGLMAPEVQEVLPELVERVPIPAEYDTTGTMVAEATSHLAINYNGFIPVLIAAVKEVLK